MTKQIDREKLEKELREKIADAALEYEHFKNLGDTEAWTYAQGIEVGIRRILTAIQRKEFDAPEAACRCKTAEPAKEPKDE